MSQSLPLLVKDLDLDLKNFRTVVQPTESDAIQAMIAISPDRFWALMQSLLDDGYLPTENILVLDSGNGYLVKEGNRRIAALKLALGFFPGLLGDVPTDIVGQIRTYFKTLFRVSIAQAR